MKTILSIDGGGIRGIIPAIILQAMEQKTGKPTAALFDLIAGTSTGGILTLGLCRDGGNGTPRFTASDMIALYADNGHKIFSRSFWRQIRSARGLLDEKYSQESLEQILQEYLGDAPFGTALTKVLISSYSIEQRSPFFFKSWRSESINIPMWQVARATSAAPTYFEPAAPVSIALDNPPEPPPGSTLKRGEFALIDGGVYINNPAVSAYAEARRIFPDEEDFLVVSLGTGEQTNPILFKDAKDWGQAEWVLPILNVVFDGVSDAVNYQMRQLLNRDEEDIRQFVRFQTELTDASDDLDDTSPENISRLRKHADQILQNQTADLERVCATLTALV